uniref:Uncharacterized protein n=1 Tax=Lepeophtheirus salmonis TaxID=72036 RepID=A0A0K2TGG3_LEPSM
MTKIKELQSKLLHVPSIFFLSSTPYFYFIQSLLLTIMYNIYHVGVRRKNKSSFN